MKFSRHQECISKQLKEADRQNRLLDRGRAVERVRCVERVTRTCITVCKIDSQREFAVCLRKLTQGLWINLEGWGGEGDGREVQQGGDICTPMADWWLRW